jgi:hypothetical protein
VAGSYEYGNEPPVCIKDGQFLDELSDYQILKNDFVQWTELASDIRVLGDGKEHIPYLNMTATA